MKCLGLAIAILALAAAAGATHWSVEEVVTIEGFSVPESLCPDTARGQVFASNILAPEDHYWDDDGQGFISVLDPEGKVITRKWLDSAPDAVIHGPKGMCVLAGKLYFTDNATLKRCDADGPGQVETIPLPQSKKLNDLATDGTAVFVSDTALGLVYRVTPEGAYRTIPAPESINGLACHEDRLYGVSWDLHEVYELDPQGQAAPQPFGLAGHFTNLDGIEVLEDGTFVVSDFMGNKVSAITPDRKTVYTLRDLESPADIGLDREGGLLYVPQFMRDRAVIYRLKPGAP